MRAARFTALAFLALLQATTARAQESPGLDALDPSTQVEPAASVLRQLQERRGDAERLAARLNTVSGEDSLVLHHRLTAIRQDLLRDVHQLGEIVLSEAEPASSGVEELRAALEVSVSAVADWLWSALDRLQVQMARKREELTEDLSARDRLIHERRLARMTDRYDEGLQLLHDQIDLKRRLEISTEDDEAQIRIELEERADVLSGQIDLYAERLEDARALERALPDDPDFALLETIARTGLDRTIESFSLVLSIMDQYGMPTDSHRAQLLSVSSRITSDLLDSDVLFEMIRSWAETLRSWLVEHAPGLALEVIVFLVILGLFYLFARIVRRLIEKGLERSRVRVSQLLQRMLVSAVFNIILLIGLIVALAQLGISLAPLLTGIGVAGFIVGFALQDTLGNFAAGMMILMYQPYDVGDFVDVGGVFGKVHKMSLVSTTILTIDNQTLVVPNSKIWGDVIKNVTAQHLRRVDLVFGISYSDDIPHAEDVLNTILKQHEKVLEDPAPMVRLHQLNESSVDFIVRPWVKTADYWDVYWDITREVKMRFDAEGITIPFPQRDVHHHGSPPPHVDEAQA